MFALPDDFAALVKFDLNSGAVQSREGKRLEFKVAFQRSRFLGLHQSPRLLR